jgi:acetyltransferase-like isoleucine patch superfamily enzyme
VIRRLLFPLLRRHRGLYLAGRSILCRWQHIRYGLRNAHPTCYVGKYCWISSDLVTHEYVYVGPYCIIGPRVTLGAYTMLGPRVCFVGDDHRIDVAGVPMIFSGRPPLRPTIVGRDVWIGAGAIVLSGVTIGDGAVIAAGTVVTSDVQAFQVHGGVPNRKLGDRFDGEQRLRHAEMLAQSPTRGEFCEYRY